MAIFLSLYFFAAVAMTAVYFYNNRAGRVYTKVSDLRALAIGVGYSLLPLVVGFFTHWILFTVTVAVVVH